MVIRPYPFWVPLHLLGSFGSKRNAFPLHFARANQDNQPRNGLAD